MSRDSNDKPTGRRSREPGFPLSIHKASGNYCKRIKGRVVYFGKDKEAALALWNLGPEVWLAGGDPRPRTGIDPNAPTVVDVVNVFLTVKQAMVDSGGMSPRTFRDYHDAGKLLAAHFGQDRKIADLTPADLVAFRAVAAMGKRGQPLGPVATMNILRSVRSILKYAHDADLIDRPIKYQVTLTMPTARQVRQARDAKGQRMFEAADVHKMLAVCTPAMKAFIMLGVNCGFGQMDCSKFPFQALDLKGGWHRFERPKTGVARRCPLWPETIKAIDAYLTKRKSPRDHRLQDRVFTTRYGGEWLEYKQHEDSRVTVKDAIGLQFGKLVRDLGIHRPGLSFYALRHGFSTVAEGAGDHPVVEMLMGHVAAPDDMAARYREQLVEERIRKVVDHVHAWFLAGANRSI